MEWHIDAQPGLDLSERPTRAVVVDDRGDVLARGTGASGADAVKAVMPGQTPQMAGVAIPVEGKAQRIAGIKAVTRCSPGAAAVAAETWIGAAKGTQHVICLIIGDEVFGLMPAGKAWSGAHNRAGAAGWLALNPVERQDYRGSAVSPRKCRPGGIAERPQRRDGDPGFRRSRCAHSERQRFRRVECLQSRGGDGVAISVVRDTAKYIGMAVATLAAAIDPEVVVVGGVVAAADLMLEPVRQECARRLSPDAMSDLRVDFSTLGPDAIAIGAARIAMLA